MTSNHLLFWLIFCAISFIITLISVSIFIEISKKVGFLSNQHSVSIREERVPRAGGVVFSLIFCSSLLIIKPLIPQDYFWSILIGGGLISFIGFLDDLKGLSPFSRILSQMLFVFFISYNLGVFSDINYQAGSFKILFIPSFVICSVWMMNTFNFIDGADGLLSTNVALISLFSGIILFTQDQIYLGLSLLILASINLAFLTFNWAPARVFMGDCGSLFLGSLFVIIPTYTVLNSLVPFYTWAILLSVFYIETSVTLIFRIFEGKQIFKERHNYHAYQQLILSSGNHSAPAKISILLQVFWIIPLSSLSFIYNTHAEIITVTAIFPLIIIFYYFGPRKAKWGQRLN